MKSRVWFALMALAAAIIVAGLLKHREAPAPAPIPVAIPQPRTPPPVSQSIPDTPVTILPIAASAANLGSPETTAEDDLSTLSLIFSQYQRQFDGNPVGENDEITAALLGKNRGRLAYLPAGKPFVDSAGHLIDRWGTPYFFHALSGKCMEITSAGPDRKLHTPDDIHSER